MSGPELVESAGSTGCWIISASNVESSLHCLPLQVDSAVGEDRVAWQQQNPSQYVTNTQTKAGLLTVTFFLNTLLVVTDFWLGLGLGVVMLDGVDGIGDRDAVTVDHVVVYVSTAKAWVLHLRDMEKVREPYYDDRIR